MTGGPFLMGVDVFSAIGYNTIINDFSQRWFGWNILREPLKRK